VNRGISCAAPAISGESWQISVALRFPLPVMVNSVPPPKHFALIAAIFEGSLVLAAVGLGRWLGQSPLGTFSVNSSALLLGVAGTLPPLGLFWLCLKCPLRPFTGIARILHETLVPLFANCSLVELAVIAALAGLGEETLFRGVVQAGVADKIGGPFGIYAGLLAAAALFGLMHPISPSYAVLAGLIGLYLGWIWLLCGNLLTPITIHGVYDFLALAYLVKVRKL
jgi:membrane protease YdiL (CAAX protease family)